MRRRLTVGVLLVTVLAGCGSDDKASSPSPTTGGNQPTSTTAPPRPDYVSTVATAAVGEVGIYDVPGQLAPTRTLPNPQPPYNTPLAFLVTEQQGEWLKVLLPVRPNGSSGWIRASEVTTREHEYRIVVELGAHALTVYKGTEVFLKEPVGIGRAETPTPGGLYYTKELLQPQDDAGRPLTTGPYGPYVYTLSGFSEVLFDFAGGEGVIGIHGTNDPSGLGTDVSHGCIRMSNDAITKLASTFDVGVPVEIKP